jgi:transposase-like protein
MMPKQRYKQAVKQEAVRQVETEDKSAAQVARKLGIPQQTRVIWRNAVKLVADNGKPARPEQME